jgi:hypothetical protein
MNNNAFLYPHKYTLYTWPLFRDDPLHYITILFICSLYGPFLIPKVKYVFSAFGKDVKTGYCVPLFQYN